MHKPVHTRRFRVCTAAGIYCGDKPFRNPYIVRNGPHGSTSTDKQKNEKLQVVDCEGDYEIRSDIPDDRMPSLSAVRGKVSD